MSSGNPVKKLAILISGSGSNLQAFIDAVSRQKIPASIAIVISNRAGVKGLERARKAGIPHQVIDHRTFASREAFDRTLIEVIDRHGADAVILAGFMRILSRGFVDHYRGRLFNIHPSLLPKYPGLHTHQRALDNGDREAGATVHFVVPELDAGPAVLQACVPIHDDDDAGSLAARVLIQEHRIYPLAVKWFCENRLHLTENGVLLDGKLLPENGRNISECE